MNIRKSILGVLGIFVLTIGVAIGASLVQQNQDFREKAAAATVAYISPASQNAQVGKDVTFYVKADTGANQILGVDLRLNFDPNIFQVVSLEKGDGANNFESSISTTFDNTNGKIKYIIYTGDKTKAITGSGINLLRVNAKSKPDATLANYTISFDPATAASGIGETQNVFTTLTPGSITLVASDASSSNTSAGEPNSCGGTCGSNYNCAMNYFCYEGFCRNPICKEDKDCDCKVAATASPKPVIKSTAKPIVTTTAKATSTATPLSLVTEDPELQIPDNEIEGREEEVNTQDARMFDIKLIGLIIGVVVGLVLLYKGIKSLKKDSGNPPMIDLNQPKTFDDTIQNPQ